MTSFWLELRLAARKLTRRPGFSLAVILLIALGVGAGSAVFTVVQRLLLTPPAMVQSPESLVRLAPAEQGTNGAAAYPDYEYYRDNARVFSDLFAYDGTATTLQVRLGSNASDADARFVTGNFFRGLGVVAAYGRALTPDDDREQADNAAVISTSLQERLFTSAQAALGQSITLNGHAFTIVGIAPRAFLGAAHDDVPVDVWLPMWKRPLVTGRPRLDMVRTPDYIHSFMVVMARLRTGVTIEQAQANASVLGRQLEQMHETADGAEVTLTGDFGLSPSRRTSITLLSKLIGGLAIIVMIIVCANLANLMLARAVSRQAESTVKLALGASRQRLMQEFALETMVLALIGGALGLLMAFWGARGLAAFLPFRLASPPAPDLRVFGFAFAVALVSAFLCAIAPALLATRRSAAHMTGARVTGGGAAVRTALVMTQVALCFLLLTGAALFVRTLNRVHDLELGFNPRGVLAVSLDLRSHGYDSISAPLAFERMVQRLSALPGVRSVALGSVVPLSGGRRTSSTQIEGRPVLEGVRTPVFDNNVVSPGYFALMQTRLVRGREFTVADNLAAPRVVVVNETFANRYWPGQDPIGKRIGSPQEWREVVGVVADTRTTNVTVAPVPMFYRPFAQAFFPRMQIYVRTSGDAMQQVPAVRRAIADVDPAIAPRAIDALERVHANGIRTFTANARLVGVLAVVALILATMGLYAVTSYLVTQRTREFGLRMAIGAQSGDVLRDVLGNALQRGALGVVIGALAAIAIVPAIERFLFELSPLDPYAFLAAGIPLLAAMLVATGLPARRAIRIEPIVALRGE